MYREGDNVSQTSTTRKNARQHHPPQTKPPSQSGQNPQNPALPVNQEGDSVAGGRFDPRKVVLLWEGGFTQTGKAIMYPGG